MLLAGCGGDAADPAPEGAPVKSAEVAATAQRCGVSRDVAPEGDVVPAELRPAPAQVAAASRTDSGYEARVIYARPLREVINAILERAEAAGQEVTFREFEGSDGELSFRRGDTETELRLLAVRKCPSVSQATITAEQG
jgi:hypothetical protein